MKLRVGSRKSPLAKAQAGQVVDQLLAAHPDLEVEWVWIVTSGDRFRDRPLQNIGGKGLFLKEIEESFLAGDIDLAIHAGKDIPADLPEVDTDHPSTRIDEIMQHVILDGAQTTREKGLEIEARGFGRSLTTQDTRIGTHNFIENGPRAKATFSNA